MDEARFRAPPAEDLIAVPLDGLIAVYHRASGQTHVLAEPAPSLLAAMADTPQTAQDLLAALGIEAPEDEDRVGLAEHLEGLIQAGLVTRA